MKKLFLLFFAFSFFNVTFAQYQLIQKYEPTDLLENGLPNIVKIPFSKYRFDNGLTLIVSENHSNQLVNVNITYKGGSSNDYADLTGMAYMVFKLMDKSTRHLKTAEYENTINQYGGRSFSQITPDRTSFSATVPRNLLSTVLWMESDRQAYFLDSLTPEVFDKAKLEIFNSIYHQKKNLPDLLSHKNLYVFGHPYYWPEYGIIDHYQSITLNDLKKFYLDWYGSNNTIITITGDVKTQDVVNLVSTYFSELTKAPQSQINIDILFNQTIGSGGVEITKPRFISYKSSQPNPQLRIIFNTVPKFDPAEKELNSLACRLGQGKNSVLYNELVKKGYAVSINAQHKTFKYFGEFSIDVMANADTSLSVILAKINSILNDISVKRNISEYIPAITNSISSIGQEPFIQPTVVPQQESTTSVRPNNKQAIKDLLIKNKAELSYNESKSGELIFQTVAKFKTNDIMMLESLQNKGMALAERELMTGKPENISLFLTEYNKLSPSRFYEIFDKYMMWQPKLYVSIVPKNKEKLIAAPDNIAEKELKTSHIQATDRDLVYRFPATEINLKRPKVVDFALNSNMPVKTETAPNKMIISLAQNNNFPITSFNIRMDASPIIKLLPNLDVAAIIANLYSEWFETQGLDNPLKAATLAGNKVEFIANGQYVDIHLTCPVEQKMTAKESILQFLNRPEYGLGGLYTKFVKRVNDSSYVKNFMKQDFEDVINKLSNKAASNAKPDDNMQKMESSSMEKKKLSALFYNMYCPQNMIASTYGNIDVGLYNDYLMRLSSWQTPGNMPWEIAGSFLNPEPINETDLKIPTEGSIYFLPDNNTQTATIVVEYMQLPVEISSNYYTGKLANFIFGNALVNQLNMRLASRNYVQKIKTLTYFRDKKECFAISINVKPENLVEAHIELMIELDNFKSFRPEKDYFNQVKNKYLYNDLTNHETFGQKELFINNLISNKVPTDVFNNLYEKTKKISASQIAKFWKSSYIAGNERTVVIGNEAQLKINLDKSGSKIIKIDKSGTIIN